MVETVVVTVPGNQVTVSTPGPQGPRGKTILNGTGVPSANLGLEGDFYYDKNSSQFYGPKLSDVTWSGAVVVNLGGASTLTSTWSTGNLVDNTTFYSIAITHNLGYNPNVTVKNSAGDILETGINYDSTNQITLTMAQPFGGTAYLS